MSTAGKVLSVLIAMVAALWVLMAATVAEYNRNGTKAVEDLQKQVVQFTDQVAKAQVDLNDMYDRVRLEKVAGFDARTVLEARQAETEKKRAQERETASRIKLQLEGTNSTVESATMTRQQRIAEKEAETQAKADAEKLVEQLKAENSQLLAQLTGLRDKFRATLQLNKELVERLLRDGGGATTRPASFIR